MADNFEQLGFQVKVDGADSAVSNLDRIEKRLESLGETALSVKKAQISLANAQLSLANSQKAYENAQRSATNAENARKNAAIAVTNAELRLNQVLNNQKATQTQILLAQNGLLSAQNSLNSALNTEISAQSNVDKARNQLEKTTNAVTTAELNLQNAIDKEKEKQDKASQAIKNKVNAQKEEENQLKKNTASLGSYIAKITSVTLIARKLGRVISSAIQESANYIENLNLFAVAYGDVYEETLDWALDLADGFGLASNEVLKFAGTFRQLSTSLRLVEDTANSVSKTVTQLGYDISALFNTSVENAMEKLQSGLFSGNVRPLRAYGIDISQNQIDALFETNEALASLNANARNLSQSDKVLARLIITLRDGSNAFGTMNREINTLQSQIRILQGSFANFKLAIGDLIYEPTRRTLIVVNAFIIAMTNVIRTFKPLQRKDENNMLNSVAMGAEEANEQMDELNGKLADFDKFNVLGGQSNGYTNDAITQALTDELAKQQALYEEQVKLMDDIENEAKELAKSLEPIAVVLGVILATWSVSKISSIIKHITAVNGAISLTNALLVGSLIWAMAKTIEAFREGDWVTGVFATTLGVVLASKIIYLNKTVIVGLWQTIGKKLIPVIINAIISFGSLKAMLLSVASAAVTGGVAFMGAWAILSILPNNAQKVVGGIMAIAGAFIALTTAILAYKGVLTWGTALPALTAAVGVAIAGGMAYKGQIKEISRFADGGYSNANLIMTHENGKREWVGKAAGSSAIVNDTQMSDIMEVAVAKGVYNALSARSTIGGNVPTNETIVVKIGEEPVFKAVRKVARRQGQDFANI